MPLSTTPKSPRFTPAHFVVCLLVGLAASTPGAVRAERAKASALFKKGMAEFVLKHYDAAIGHFESGYREEPQPAFLYNIASAHKKAGHTALAIEFYERYLELAPDAKDGDEVRREVAELKATQPVNPATMVARPPPPANLTRAPTARTPESSAVAPSSANPLVVATPADPGNVRRRNLGIALGVVAGALVVGGVVTGVVLGTQSQVPVTEWNAR